ncbi:hypothetical protein O1L60_02570 [Streptomyces diastatochromogenes]|nr:hypothetical protein [Streptomyces diastatochromogenes]
MRGGADGAGAVDVADVLGLLGALVDKSLVVAAPDGDGAGMRFRLLETVAEYAGSASTRPGNGRRRSGATTHYRELARRTDPELRGPRQVAAIARFEREHDNLRGALRTAVALGDEQEVLCLVHTLSWFWQLRNHQADARTWAVEAGRLGPDPFRRPSAPPSRSTGGARTCRRRGPASACGGPARRPAVRPGDRGRRGRHGPRTARDPRPARRPGRRVPPRPPADLSAAGHDVVLRPAHDRGARRARRDPGPDRRRLPRPRHRLGPGLRPPHAGQARRARRRRRRGARPLRGRRGLLGIAESLAARGEAYEREAGSPRPPPTSSGRPRPPPASAPAPRCPSSRPASRPYGSGSARRGRGGRTTPGRGRRRGRAVGAEAAGAGRLLLAQHYGHTGRTGLARAQLSSSRRSSGDHPALFWGLVGGTWAWLDCLDGAHDRALDRLARAVADVETLAHLVAPHLVVAQFGTAAWARGGRGAPGDAETGPGSRRVRRPRGLRHRRRLPPLHPPDRGRDPLPRGDDAPRGPAPGDVHPPVRGGRRPLPAGGRRPGAT